MFSSTMRRLKYFNRGLVLTILSIVLAVLQTLWEHAITTDYAHQYFSKYFYIECSILLITIVTGLRYRIAIVVYLLIFFFETVWFFMNETPISPDHSLMLAAGAIRIYVLSWLFINIRRTS